MTTTSAVYISVIEDVINKVREEFTNGPGEEVLKELQGVNSISLSSVFHFYLDCSSLFISIGNSVFKLCINIWGSVTDWL